MGALLLYGNNGIWTTDSAFESVKDFNEGLPAGVDNRNVKSVVRFGDDLYAATQFGLWKRVGDAWQSVALPVADVRLSDLYARGDTLVAVGRSALFISRGDGFERVEIKRADGEHPTQTLFRIAFNVHSGQIFGMPGIVIMDALAVVLSVLAITGIVFFIARKWMKGHPVRKAKTLKISLKWHSRVGVYAFAVLLFVTVSGWILRPPALIALVKVRVPMAGTNAWEDKLRAIRYDENIGGWMLSTSDGFYSLGALSATPRKMQGMPPVSVMGINVWLREDSASWLIGSFGGMYRWNALTGEATDYFTGERAPEKAGAPFGTTPIIGYAAGTPIEYYKGADFAPMPQCFSTAPMSLWNLALEIHTGRIYTFLGPVNLLFIFFSGIAMAWLLILGWKLRKKKH